MGVEVFLSKFTFMTNEMGRAGLVDHEEWSLMATLLDMDSLATRLCCSQRRRNARG